MVSSTRGHTLTVSSPEVARDGRSLGHLAGQGQPTWAGCVVEIGIQNIPWLRGRRREFTCLPLSHLLPLTGPSLPQNFAPQLNRFAPIHHLPLLLRCESKCALVRHFTRVWVRKGQEKTETHVWWVGLQQESFPGLHWVGGCAGSCLEDKWSQSNLKSYKKDVLHLQWRSVSSWMPSNYVWFTN